MLWSYENTSLYTAIFQKEPEGGYTVVIPALKGCVSYGETIEEAAIAAKEAIESYLGSLAKDHLFVIPANLPAGRQGRESRLNHLIKYHCINLSVEDSFLLLIVISICDSISLFVFLL
ncbi:MAG: type II toxin-antitoxin system HicB family antitoxin [Patescibacteria group bacterium]